MVVWLTPDRGRAYAALTTPTLAPLLGDIGIPEPVHQAQHHGLWAAGATFSGLPGALALLKRSTLQVEIISLVVATRFRRLGMAGMLLGWLRDEIQSLGYRSIRVCYPLNHPSTTAMARLTDAQQGWTHAPGQRLVHLNRAGAEVLLQRLTTLTAHWQRSPRFQARPWSALTPAQRVALDGLRHQAPAWACPMQPADRVGPWHGVQRRDDTASHLLLDQGEPAGWIVVDRLGEALLRVSQWWVSPRLQGRGIGLLLLQRALQIGLSHQPLPEEGCFGIGAGSDAMLALSRRHLEPRAIKIWSTEEALLILGQA